MCRPIRVVDGRRNVKRFVVCSQCGRVTEFCAVAVVDCAVIFLFPPVVGGAQLG